LLLENAAALAELGDARVPGAALRIATFKVSCDQATPPASVNDREAQPAS